jgi:hypothetical protein
MKSCTRAISTRLGRLCNARVSRGCTMAWDGIRLVMSLMGFGILSLVSVFFFFVFFLGVRALMRVDTALRKQRLHVLGHQSKNGTLPVMEELTLGIAASALSGLVSTPFSNIVTRKQTHALLYPGAKRPSFADVYHDIMREKGITGFWSGYAASLLLTFNPSITFLLYEFAKPHAVKLKRGRFSKLDMFLLVALCKAAATTLTFPLNTIRIRSQMDYGGDEWEGMIESSRVSKGKHHGKGLDARYRQTLRKAGGIIELITQIVKREGISALYIGLGGALFKGFFTHGSLCSSDFPSQDHSLTKIFRRHHDDQATGPPFRPEVVLFRVGRLQPQ